MDFEKVILIAKKTALILGGISAIILGVTDKWESLFPQKKETKQQPETVDFEETKTTQE